MLEEVFFLAVTLFYLFILESSSFGCAWFDIFKDIMIHIYLLFFFQIAIYLDSRYSSIAADTLQY